MPDPTSKHGSMVETLATHLDGEKARILARQITDLVFDIRSKSIFSDEPGLLKMDPAHKKTMTLLMTDFREKAGALTPLDIPKTDDELYSQIILPLVKRLINQSA